jgi:HPt (histidine-containing phosphotransfer) domain-containing protein
MVAIQLGVGGQKYHAMQQFPAMSQEQASNIVTAVCVAQIRARLGNQTSPQADIAMNNVDSRLDSLHVRYRASLVGKRADIERAVRDIQADCRSPKYQDALLQLVHRLAGSAESYGFVEIGRTAADADALLDLVRASDSKVPRAEAMCATLERLTPLLEKLLSELQRAIDTQAGKTEPARSSGVDSS